MMTAEALVESLSARGIRLIPNPPKLTAEPASRLTDADRVLIRAHKSELLAALAAPPDAKENLSATENQEKSAPAADPPRSMAPDSRHPLVEPEVRAMIEAIEAEARAKGWPPELLWNANFWDLPRGLAAVLDSADEIVEVAPDYIAILKTRRDVLRFRRYTG